MDNVDQSLGNADQLSDNADQSLGNADQSSDNADQPLDNADQPLGNADQSSDNADQLLGNVDQPSGNTDIKLITMKLFYVLILILFVFTHASAQLAEQDTARRGYMLATSGMLITGNVERFLWTSTGELRHVAPVWGFISTNTYQYGTIFNNKTEDDLISRNFVYLFPKKRWYPYQMTWLERNWRRKIDHRYQIGLGGTWVVIRQSKHLLKLSLTGTYESTHFRGINFENYPDGETSTIRTWRATVRVFGNNVIGKNKLRLRYEAWIQPSLEDADNFRYHLEGVASLPMGKRFSLQTNVNYSFENIVLESIKQRDLIWTFGISFQSF